MRKQQKLFSVAAIVIFKNKYLFQKRDKKKGIFYPDLYGLFGGNNKGNEKPNQTMQRELIEETNIDFKDIKHFLTIKLESDHYNNKNSSIFRRFFFICKLPNNFKSKIKILEGQYYKFINIKKVNVEKFVPFDYAAVKYHQMLRTGKKIIPKIYLKS